MEGSVHLPVSACLILAYENECFTSEIIQCTNSASFSAILTIGQYMCLNYPDLAPPQFPHELRLAPTEESLESKQQQKAYFQPWCDYLNTLIQVNHKNGQIVEKDKVVYFICRIDKSYYEEINKIILDKFKTSSKDYVDNLIKQARENQKQSPIHVGIINFSASQLSDQVFRPKVNLLSLFTGNWFRHGDIWRRYDVLKGSYPTEEQVHKTDIFILSGSTYSVNDNNPHVQKTMEILLEGLKKNKKLKILGLCFGHQALAKYCGGQVTRRQTYSGVEVIKFESNYLQKYPFLNQVSKLNDEGYLMFEFHNDYVTKIPQGFINLGKSQSSQSQAMISQDGRCLTFQFHSQYTLGYIKEFEIKMTRLAKKAKHQGPPPNYKPRFEAIAKYGIQRHLQSCKIIRETARKFIQWQIE